MSKRRRRVLWGSWSVLFLAFAGAQACDGDPPPSAHDVAARDGAPRDGRSEGAAEGSAEDLVVARDLSVDSAISDGSSGEGDVGGAPDAIAPVEAGTSCPQGSWCSTLFLPTWTPSQPADGQGRFLHDFSYAGYHRGEVAIPATPPGKIYDVVTTYKADATGKADATAAVQEAIDAAKAAGGGVVYFPAGSYRFDGVLRITGSKIVLRGAGSSQTRLSFTRSQGMSRKAHITFSGAVKRGADVPLAQDAPNRATVVHVKALAGLKVGDEVGVGWVITDAFVADHGMTGYWKPFIGKWKAIFRRTIVAVDAAASPPRVTLDIPLRYPAKVKYQASLRHERGYLSEGGIEHLALANAVTWSDAWANTQTHVLYMGSVKDGWVRDVVSFPSPVATGWNASDTTPYHLQSGGLRIVDSKRVTITDVHLANAQNRGGGGNGYLFHVTRSNEILIVDASGKSGRHNFIQNWDFGTTGCVFLRCESAGSATVTIVLGIPIAVGTTSEYHHALAMGNLVDSCVLDDGWRAENRLAWSSGAGHTSTQGVFWNSSGKGLLESMQYGWGYIIGTSPTLTVNTSLVGANASGSQPEDLVEGKGKGATLWPRSLYEEQKRRRLAP